MGVYIHFTRGWSGHFHFMIEIILMTFIWILWTLSSPLTQSDKYRKWKHTSFWFIYGFKNIVKLKVRSSAFQYLLRIKLTHSKMSGLTYKKFQLQEYLISPIFNNESRNLLFRLRTRAYRLTLLLFNPTHDILMQFLLYCSSLNLTPNIQIPSNYPNFTCITRQSSIMIHDTWYML